MASITSANAILTLSIASLYPVPQVIKGFAADDVYNIDALEAAETMMGVDGFLSAGFVYVPVKQGIALQGDSPSNAIFETWYYSQRKISDVYVATGSIVLPALGKKYAMINGYLTTYPSISDAGRVLKPRKYMVTWQSIALAPI